MARLEHTWDEVDKVISAVRGDSDPGTHPITFSTENVAPTGQETLPLFGTEADHVKLDTIKLFSTPSAGTVKGLYESNPDTNVFDDEAQDKLTGIEEGAQLTSAAHVRAAGATMNDDDDLSGNDWFLDENTLISADPTKAPSQSSVKAYVDSVVQGGVTYQGPYDAANNVPDLDSNPSGISLADMYVVSTSGIFFTEDVSVGATLIANQNNPVLLNHWTVLQPDLDAAEIKALYESNPNTNEFDDGEKLKLNALDPSRLFADLFMDGHSIFARPLGDNDGGVIIPLVDGASFAYASDAGYQPADGAVVVRAGIVELRGSAAHVISLEGSEIQQVRVTAEGILFGVDLPDPGWQEVDTSIEDIDLGDGIATGAWIEINTLGVTLPENIIIGDTIHAFTSLYVENKSSNRSGELNIGIGINGALPLGFMSVAISPGFSGIVPGNFTSVATSATAGDLVTVWAQKGDGEQAQFGLLLLGSVNEHRFILSKDAVGGGGGGDVSKVGTPVADQIPIWVGNGPIKGSDNFQFIADKTLTVNDGRIIVRTESHADWGIHVGNNTYSADPEVGFKMMIANNGVAQFHYRGDGEYQRIDFELWDGVDRVPGLEIHSTHLHVPGDIELSGDYRGDVTPDGDLSRVMGAADQRWETLFAQNIFTGIIEGDEMVFGAQDITQGDVTRFFVLTAGLEPSADLHDQVTINEQRIVRESDLGDTVQRHNENLVSKIEANAFAKTQHSTPLVLIDPDIEDAVIDWDLENGQMAHLELLGSGRTINPINMVEGALYTLGVSQGLDGGHSINTWNNVIWQGGVPFQSEEEGDIDWYSYTAKGGVLHGFDPGSAASGGPVKLQGRETIWIPASAMRPTVADGCSPVADYATGTDMPDISALEFGFAANEHAQFSVAFPRSWDEGVLQFVAAFTSLSGDTSNVSFALQAVEVDHRSDIAQGYGSPIAVTRANVPGATDLVITGESDDIVVQNLSDDRGLAFFRLFRDIAGADALADTVRFLGIHMYYESDKANDDGQAGGIDLSEDMAAWWSMNEANGTRFDSHVNSLDMTEVNGPTSQAGVLGNAVGFQLGDESHLTRPFSADEAWQMRDRDLTVAYWMYQDSFGGGYSSMVDNGGLTDESSDYGWRVGTNTGRQGFRGGFSINDTKIEINSDLDIGIQLDEWNFFIVEYDRDGEMAIWVDGIKQSVTLDISQFNGVDVISAASHGMFIGGNTRQDTRYMSGRLDEVAIWNRLLTEEEKTALYNEGVGLTYEEATGG